MTRMRDVNDDPQPSARRHARKHDNGDGSIRQRADGRWEGRYSIPITGGGRRRVSIFGKTRTAVREQLREAINQRDRGVVQSPARQTAAGVLGYVG